MRNILAFVAATTVLFGIAAPTAHAQKGVGDPTGVARQPAKPQIVSLSGKIVEVQTGPCESTTGRALAGSHLILETAQEDQLNIHLGPADAVADMVARLSAGQALTVKAFRTEKMKENHYVAQSLTSGKTTFTLRDAELRPVWAWGNVGPRGATAGQAAPGRGRGQGWGRGQGGGRGQGWGCGQGWGRSGQPSVVPAESESAAPQERPGRIAVTAVGPSLDAAVDPRFGRCPYILLFDMEHETLEVLKNANTSSGNAGVQAAEMIAAKGAKVLLTGKVGASASEALAAAGIDVVSGCSGTVSAVITQFRAGQLRPDSEPSATTDTAPNQRSAAGKRGGANKKPAPSTK